MVQGRRLNFTGEYRHTIDAKGRLIVPSRLREEFTGDRVILSRWMGNCIAMWSEEGWRKIASALMEQGSANPSARAFVRTMAAGAHTDEIDKQGRINVPAHLRDYSGITRECVVTGALDHGEIWSPERWDQVEASAGDLDELAQQLNF